MTTLFLLGSDFENLPISYRVNNHHDALVLLKIASENFYPNPPDGTVVLHGDGTWGPTGAGTGTVTSVAVTGDAVITVGGSPITTAGTIVLTTNQFSSGTKGVVPASGGGIVNFLRADGTWQAPPGSGSALITITGDASGSGTNTVPITLNTVNANVGTFNNVTVNGKGLVTAASNVAYLTSNQLITLSGAVTGSGTTAITTTITPTGVVAANYNWGSFVVNAAGQITSAVNNPTPVTSVGLADGSATPIYAITNSPVNTTGTLTFSLLSQTRNTVFAGPDGIDGFPIFRTLTINDITGIVVTSVSINDESTTPIYTVSPTTPSNGAVDITMLLNTQTHNTVFAGPVFTPGTAAQPTFRHLESYDLEGAAPGSATDVIYNGTVGGVPNSFAADSGFTYNSTVPGATTVVLGPGGVVGSGNTSTVTLNAPTAIFQGQSFSVGTQAGGELTISAGVTAYNLAAGGDLTLEGGEGGGGGPNQASMFLQGGQASGGAGYIQVIGGESFSSASNPTPLAGNVTIQGGNNQQYATPTNAIGGGIIIEAGQRFTFGNAPIVDQYNGSILFMTSGTNRFRIQPLGDWQIGSTLSSGAPGQVITSQGSGNPPSWTNLDSTSIYSTSANFATVGSGGTNLGSVTLNPTNGSSTFFDGQTLLISVHGTCTGDSTHLVEFTAQVNGSNIITFSLPVTGGGITIPYKTNIYLIFNTSGTLFKSWIEITSQTTGILGAATSNVSAISNTSSVGSLTGPIAVGINGAINAAGVTCVADAITIRSI